MSKLKKVILGSSLRTINMATEIIVAFFMLPFIVNSLGIKHYGLWVLIGTFLGFHSLLDFGFTSGITRYISYARGENDTDAINKYVSISLLVFIILGLISLIISILSILIIPLFVTNLEEIRLFKYILVILGVNLALSFPMKTFSGLLSSYLRFDIVSYVAIFRILFTNLLFYIYLSNNYGILMMSIISLISTLLQAIIILLYTRAYFPQLLIKFRGMEFVYIKNLYNYSYKTFIAQIGDIFRLRVDNFVIAAFLGVGNVAYYSIAMRIINYFVRLTINIFGVMMPVFSTYEGEGNFEKLQSTFLLVTKFSILFSTYMTLSVMLYGKYFIMAWMGPNFISTSSILYILILPFGIALMQNPSLALLYGIGKHHYYSVSNTIEGVFNLILSIILVRYYGIYGVALGTIIPMLIFKIFIQPYYCCKVIKIDLSYYYIFVAKNMLKVIIPFLLFATFARGILYPSFKIIFPLAILQMLLFIIYFAYIILKKDIQMIFGNSRYIKHIYGRAT